MYKATVKMFGGAVVAGKRSVSREFDSLDRAMRFVLETRYCDYSDFVIIHNGKELMSGEIDNSRVNAVPTLSAVQEG